MIPIFTIDVAEHAYYLQYKNSREDYVKQLFHITNWRKVEENFNKIQKKPYIKQNPKEATKSPYISTQKYITIEKKNNVEKYPFL